MYSLTVKRQFECSIFEIQNSLHGCSCLPPAHTCRDARAIMHNQYLNYIHFYYLTLSSLRKIINKHLNEKKNAINMFDWRESFVPCRHMKKGALTFLLQVFYKQKKILLNHSTSRKYWILMNYSLFISKITS